MWFLRLLKWLAGAILLLLLLAVLAIFVAYWRSTNDCGRAASAPGEKMKAAVYCDYGSPDVLRIEEIARPVPSDKQMLIKVRAASVNPLDWHHLRGVPYLMRTETGLRKPSFTQLGVDYAGVVESVGKDVTAFKAGDEVFGGKRGAFAEYLVATEAAVALKPANISFEKAAAVPIAGLTALQGLRDRGHLQAGQQVLINGASGGVGTFAVQIAVADGAVVTGVCSGRNAELVRSLGGARVIDYTKEDFSQGAERYDLILDLVGTQALSRFRRVLKPNGIYVQIGAGGPNEGPWLGALKGPLKAFLLSPFVSQKMGMMVADMNSKDLRTLAELMQAGKIKPILDREYPLSETAEALRYVEKGHSRGKVIVKME